MVMGNNNNDSNSPLEPVNKDSKSFFSELIINENHSFVSEQFRENDMSVNVKQTSGRDNNSESFVSNQAKDPDIDVNAIQTKKKGGIRK